MSRDLDSILAEVVEHAAAAARPAGAAAARRRGRRRTVVRTAVAGATAMVAAGTATAIVLAADPAPAGRGSTVVVTTPNTSPSGAPPPSASPSGSPSSGASASSTPTTASGGTGGRASVSLSLPAAFAAGAPTPFSYTVANRGPGRTARVTLDLGAPTSNTPGSAPNETAVLERRATDGSWQPVTVSYDAALGQDTARYGLPLPAHGTATEQLRLIPPGVATATVRVAVDGGGSASASAPLKTPALTATGPASASPGSAPEFDFTLTDPTPAAYSGIRLHLDAYGASPACAVAVFPSASWSVGGGWSTVSLGAGASGGGWPLLGTVALAPGQDVHLRVRLRMPSSPPSCLTRGQVAVIAELPGASAVLSEDRTGPTPGFDTRGESPFFAIG
ncbi:hypothetical protein [Phaeacidiphilus oryzae]|uniref:hypothetical protein n=1 Tax=Phaeacidiphilus oryzae TaxID=348818 RepID=UPI00055B8517|nr:hypothetical protein [Phaeacidiphilus oryzae]